VEPGEREKKLEKGMQKKRSSGKGGRNVEGYYAKEARKGKFAGGKRLW